MQGTSGGHILSDGLSHPLKESPFSVKIPNSTQNVLSDPELVEALSRFNDNQEMSPTEIDRVFTGALFYANNNNPTAAFEIYMKLAEKGNHDALALVSVLLPANKNDSKFLDSVRICCENVCQSGRPTTFTYVHAILYQFGLAVTKNLQTAKILYDFTLVHFPEFADHPGLCQSDLADASNLEAEFAPDTVDSSSENKNEVQSVTDPRLYAALTRLYKNLVIDESDIRNLLAGVNIFYHQNNQPMAAFDIYIRLADKGNRQALANLQEMLLQQNEQNPDFLKLVLIHCDREERVNAAASTFVRGFLYQHGLGVEKNFKAAEKLYKSVSVYVPEAANNLGRMLEDGQIKMERGGKSELWYTLRDYYRYAKEKGVVGAAENFYRIIAKKSEYLNNSALENVTTTTTTTTATATATTTSTAPKSFQPIHVDNNTPTHSERVWLQKAQDFVILKKEDPKNLIKAIDIYIGLIDKGNDKAFTALQGLVKDMESYSDEFKYLNDILGDFHNSSAAIVLCEEKKRNSNSIFRCVSLKDKLPGAYHALGIAFNTNGQNYKQALSFFDEAAKLGLAKSSYCAGMLHVKGSKSPGVNKNVKKGLECLTQASENRDKDAHYQLGKMYLVGNGVTKSRTKAREFFAKAHGLGHPKAAFKCAQSFEMLNWNLKADTVNAEKWYGEAAITPGKCQEKAQNILETRYAESYLRKAMNPSGHPDRVFYLNPMNAVFTLGKNFLTRTIFEGRSHAQARLLLTEASLDGHPSAKFYLGQSYETTDYNGNQDITMAISCYEEAEINGDKQAEAKQALQTLKERYPFKYFTYKSEKGDGNANFQLGMMYSEGPIGLWKNHHKARIFFAKAYELGYLSAAFFCAKSFATEDYMGNQNLTEAYRWYGIAAEVEDENQVAAREALTKLFKPIKASLERSESDDGL